MKASRFFGLLVVLTLLVTLSQTMVRDSDPGLAAGTTLTVNAYDIVGNESGQGQGVLGFGENAHAQGIAINAASCEQTDVQAAIDSAITGDTVIVPAGNCTWSSQVSIPNDKKITLQGAGMDSTVITDLDVSIGQSGSRITGFDSINGRIYADGDGWRIDHCKFTSSSWTTAVLISGNRRNPAQHPIGLVDNCIFNNARVLVIGSVFTFSEGQEQHELWSQPLGLGTNNAVFVEDCTFEFNVFGNVIDTNYGGRYVLRYSTINDSYLEAHSLQGTHRATRSWEIYNNIFNQINRTLWVPMMVRGGTGVVFDNTVTGTWGTPNIALDNVRSCDSRGDGGICDGTSPWDGNEPGEAGYPCRDQIGRSTDQWLWTDENPYPPQIHEPAYAWNNKRGANDVVFYQHGCDESHAHIQPNRDYYNYDVSFDGSSGVGSGTLANRPSTCTPGVAYWATDQGEWNSENAGADGQLYKCTSTDTWELYYVPYTYPHPLRGESLVLRATPADQAIHLTWQVGASLPPTSTWQIAYDGPAGDQPSPISGIPNPTRAYTLTGLTNYTWYTVTLNGMLDSTPFLTDTVRVMPTDISVYLPIMLCSYDP